MSVIPPVADPVQKHTSFQPKLIYLAKRNAALSRSEFVNRWRQHGALGMSMPRWRNIARYVHCDALHPHNATVDLADEYDGVGLVWHRSPEARAAHLADTSSREQMERDEIETFAAPVVNFCLLTRETVVLPADAARRSSIKLTRLLSARNRADASRLASARLSDFSTLREKLKAARSELCGHVVNETLPPERGDRWGLAGDCIEELWFEDVEAALRAAQSLEASSDRGIDTVSVLTNEVVLYERQ